MILAVCSFLIINKFLLFQHSERIPSFSTRAVAYKVAQNDYVLAIFITRIKIAINFQGTRGNKHMNIETIENGL